jgi:hypothetical protein
MWQYVVCKREMSVLLHARLQKIKEGVVMSDEMRTMVVVIWHDAHAATDSWTPIDEIGQDPCVVVSAGFLLPTSDGGKDGHITLFQSKTESDDVDGVLCIPADMVKSMRVMTKNIPGLAPSK